MSKLFILCGVFLCLSLPAFADDSIATTEVSSPATETAAPAALFPSSREPWQLGIGFQYQHYKILGQSFHNLGYNASLTRYLNDWFGVETTAAMGFGHTGTSPLNLDAKSLFAGAGPHIVIGNGSRFEPWFHVIGGVEHFRFTQTNNQIGLGSNTGFGFIAGGGVDYKLGGRAYWRLQGDFIGSHFGDSIQKNYSFGTGLIFNF